MVLSHSQRDQSAEHEELWQGLGVFALKKKKINLESDGVKKVKKRWYEENGRKAAHTNTRSFKPQKLFWATNSFYKAGSALIPVISETRGEENGRKEHLSLRMNLFCKCCQMFFFHPTPNILQDAAGAARMMETNNTHPHTHLSWRRWVLPAAHRGWLGSLHHPQPEEELSAGGQSGCVGGGALPRFGCQPQGELQTHTRVDVIYLKVLWY